MYFITTKRMLEVCAPPPTTFNIEPLKNIADARGDFFALVDFVTAAD